MKEVLSSFEEALNRFDEILNETPNAMVRDAAIQRFEFTVELAWKVVQKFLRSEHILCNSPKECFKEAFSFGLITDDQIWVRMMEDRNLTVHTYDERLAEEIFSRLPSYLPFLKRLYAELHARVALT